MSQKIVKQDIAMLRGQNNNIKRGAKPWNQAIHADKLALAYRQWFAEETHHSNPWFEGF